MLGLPLPDLLLFIAVSLVICVTLCALAMEASVLFTPAFLFLFPHIVRGFPILSTNEAIGLALVVEFFGYTSSVTGYWLRHQVSFAVAGRILAVTVPLAVVGRVGSYFLPATGLLLLFGLILLLLAGIIHRAYRQGLRHTCLLCGDSVARMRMGEPTTGVRLASAGAGSRRTVSRPPGTDGPTRNLSGLSLGAFDRTLVGSGGLLAGLVGIAIGEVTNTFLTVRKRVPIKISTGTSALVLHLTILSALATNVLLLVAGPPALHATAITIPWGIGFILAPVVMVGGQIGSFLNSRLPDAALLHALTGTYVLVGFFVLGNATRGLLG